MRLKNILASMTLATLLVSCAPPAKPPAPPPPPPQAPPHYGPPMASLCQVAPFTVSDGGTANVTMAISNDGGYCAARLITAAGKPFDAPLVSVQPSNGTAAVWKYDGKTSVEYVPNSHFTGSDQFVTKLKIAGKPGYTVLNIAVTVK